MPGKEALSSRVRLVAGTTWPTGGCDLRRPPRRGLTLIELLVVFAIVGVLGAVILPAVSAAREAARRMQCSSHLRQIGIAMHAYHEVHSTFPAGHVADLESGRDGRSWGWGALLLPFIDQRPLSDQLNTVRRSFDSVASDDATLGPLQTNVSVYRCPSDSGDEQSHPYRSIIVTRLVYPGSTSSRGFPRVSFLPAHLPPVPPPPPPPPTPPPVQPEVISFAVQLAKSNYVGSIGSQWKSRRTEWNDGDFRGNGLFGRNSDLSIAKIFDGASKTLAVGERCSRNYAAAWAGTNSWQRCGFADNQMVLGTAFYPINDAPVDQNIDCDGRGSANFSSYHGGGANFLFADGSVHFLSEQIGRRVFRQLAERGDGEKLNDF